MNADDMKQRAKQEADLKAREEAKKAKEKAERHVVPLNRFGKLAEYVLDDIMPEIHSEDIDADERETIVTEMAILLGYDKDLVAGKVVKNEKHFMMTPVESFEDAKAAATKINKDPKQDEHKERLRRRVLADIIGNYEIFESMDTRNNEINQLASILGLDKSAATIMWDDKNNATA
jgi:hypothetical protein